MSSITIKAMPSEVPVSEEVENYNPKLYNKILADIQRDAANIVQAAVMNGLTQAADLSKALIADVKNELHSVSKGAAQVMAVQINDGELKKLSSEAVPYLGRLVIHAKSGINTLLVGPAGCGKTYAAGQLAEALGLSFGHLNLTAGASETWLFGRQTPSGFIEGEFSKLYKTGGVFLADEIDAADANLMLSINTAIAGKVLYNPISGETIPRHKDFVFVGAANTYGKGGDSKYTGRSRLDAATLDRFVAIKVDYNEAIEEKLVTSVELRNVLWKMRAKLIELGAQEFISTRGMQIAQLQLDGGVHANDILDSLTLSWPEDLRDQMKVEIKKYRDSGKSGEEVKKRGPGRPKKDEISF